MAMMTKPYGTSRRSMRLVEAVIIIACCAAHFTLQAQGAPSMSKTGVVKFLSQYGYIPPMEPGTEDSMSHEDMSTGIAEFQSFLGMDVTGEMDAETTHMMTMPRCGDKDMKNGRRTAFRTKRWGAFGNTWPKGRVTYDISKYTRRLDKRSVDEGTARAFGLWSKYIDLDFSPRRGQADIEIKFERGPHGPSDVFDGPGKVLAHALSPGKGTWIHFDDDEDWTTNSNRGTDYLSVAVHEIGHSLGLDHSRVKDSVMWPYVSNQRTMKLHEDDIRGIQARYGPRTTNHRQEAPKEIPQQIPQVPKQIPQVPKRIPQVPKQIPQVPKLIPQVPQQIPELCEDPRIDATFISRDGDIFFFKGEYHWKLTTKGIAAGYPKLIAKTWVGLPSNIDYALTKENGQTYFFKGSKYWSFSGTRMKEGYPRQISDTSESRDAVEAGKRASSLAAMVYCIFSKRSG